MPRGSMAASMIRAPAGGAGACGRPMRGAPPIISRAAKARPARWCISNCAPIHWRVDGNRAHGKYSMKSTRRRFLYLTAGAAALASPSVLAQVYPARPITIIVPLPAGGAVDSLARILAEPMRRSLGQTIVIENVSGASGSIGVGRVARAAPDGYTLGIGTGAQYVNNGAIYSLPYDLVKDFAPIALLPKVPFWIIGRKGLPASDLKELIAWLKANPGHASAGTIGAG